MSSLLGQKLDPILWDISGVLLDEYEIKPNFPDKSLFSAMHIFSSVVMDKMYERQDKLNMPQSTREAEAFTFGKKLRELVMEYTDIDSHELANRL